MIVLDSSAWLEIFLEGPNVSEYRPYLLDVDSIIVPSICVFEVTRVLRRLLPGTVGEAFMFMTTAEMVELDSDLAEYASAVAATHRLAMGDAIIYATAIVHDAELWTQDADLQHLPGVRYVTKAPAA